MSRLKFKTGAGHRRGRARQTRPCVLGARHAAVSKGVGARRSTKDSRKGSLLVCLCVCVFVCLCVCVFVCL